MQEAKKKNEQKQKKKAERINERLHTWIKRFRKNWRDEMFDLLIAIAWYGFYIVGILFGLLVIATTIKVMVNYLFYQDALRERIREIIETANAMRGISLW
ncbi:hypothetical protein DS742_28010 [Lacrimispora amygdalina]|uniref:Uncharacterized protein n=1 Tax=Lacrimispora amygdalina TaxID=253257 RepID=A0A3E2N3S5_9FIRM|nr:hypothetical protein [Clostridium indicum]RFZ75622.1 hypothetical protein DS742_28010 [Clostridium indicum]